MFKIIRNWWRGVKYSRITVAGENGSEIIVICRFARKPQIMIKSTGKEKLESGKWYRVQVQVETGKAQVANRKESNV